MARLVTGLVVVLLIGRMAAGVDSERLKVQRKEVFEFTEKPTLKVDGDKVFISFAVKDFCDVTIAVEDANGKILRHLASGVLGKNAPEPFQKDSLKQTVVWDGKDEIGRYLVLKAPPIVRVSLGLKAQYERALYWSGHRMVGSVPLVRPAPEGVYVLFSGQGTQLRQYDHQGNYLRTVYPLQREHTENANRVKWQAFPPDGEKLPSKLAGDGQDSILSIGGASADVYGGRIAFASGRLLLMPTDFSKQEAKFDGPIIGYERARDDQGSEAWVLPHATAFSPDGKRVYLTGYTRFFGRGGYGYREHQHMVNVVTLDDGKMVSFPRADAKVTHGTDNERFAAPMGVACDNQGRVYVSDNLNSRIQVYAADGKFLKSIPTLRPGIIAIHPKTQQIYVVSTTVVGGYGFPENVRKPDAESDGRLRILGPFDDPKEKAAYAIEKFGSDYRRIFSAYDITVAFDFWTDPVSIWTVMPQTGPDPSSDVRCAPRMWQIEKGKLVLKRDFSQDAAAGLVRPRPAKFGRPRLYVNHSNGDLYLGQITWDTQSACKSFREVIRIDPATGKQKALEIPTNAEDTGFDWLGNIYLRQQDAVVRFDPTIWREVPYDYGEDRKTSHGDGGAKEYNAVSAMILPGCIGGTFHLGGIGVAADGTTVVSCINPNSPEAKKAMAGKGVRGGVTAYTPPVYPGRNMGFETHIFDKHGKVLKDDVAPGISMSNFVQIDRDGYVYVLAASTPYIDGKVYFNGRGCTLFKVKPGKAKCLTAGGIIPLAGEARPKRSPDMTRPDPTWIEGAEWVFGPVGADGHYGSGGKCDCYVNGRFALDYYARSFAPEVDRFRVVVLDSAGNVIMRIGRFGNIEDGMPLVKPDPALLGKMGDQPQQPRSIGGDEVAIMHCMNLAVHSDRRLFLADIGNQCIRSVKLTYHAEEKVTLPAKSAP